MDILDKNGYNLRNLAKINIILGKNGCGKSTALKAVETVLSNEAGKYKYITPERGGNLKYDPNLDQNIINNGQGWIAGMMRNNQYQQFRQQSVQQYRKLEIAILKEIEKVPSRRNDHTYTFETTIQSINELLENIEIRRTENDFDIYKKITGEKIDNAGISSGESELISLAIECLYFEKNVVNGQSNIIFMDEPDVHLHPDLQIKFSKFMKDLVSGSNFSIIIATHSTAFLGALTDYPDARIAFMHNGQKNFDFKEINETYSRILPIFGAHPLSNLFNESPVFLVEGEDDVRIWQQAIRSSMSKLKLYPCAVDSIDNLNRYESEVIEIINAVYDHAKGYSFRDRDDDSGELSDRPPIMRFRLSCRNAENLIVTDEVLANLDTNWGEIESRIENWITSNSTHLKYQDMLGFKNGGFQRKTHHLKEVRNVIIGLSNSNKPWEIAVGQVIGKLKLGNVEIDMSNDKIGNYLGSKIIAELF